MGSTLCCHFVHVVFSTKDRQPLIVPELTPRLYAYLGGIARHNECSLVAAGGIEDHIHVLLTLHPSHALADLVRDLKSNSSRWMHEEGGIARFAWQSGYAAFSVSRSNLNAVGTYIDTQREHHARRTFKEELVEFLERHGVEYDERYIFG